MTFDLSIITEHWGFIQKAFGMTLLLSGLSIALGLVVGVLLAVGRVYGPRIVDLIFGFFVDSMRAIPVLVVLVWAYLAFPVLFDVRMNPLTGATAALGLHLSAYVAEIVRSGLTSVRRGQYRAALALGLTKRQAVFNVILPQALIRMIPPMGSFVIIAVKDSAIASVIAFPELLRSSQTLVGQTFRPLEIYTVAMLLYLAILYPTARVFEYVYRRLAPLGSS